MTQMANAPKVALKMIATVKSLSGALSDANIITVTQAATVPPHTNPIVRESGRRSSIRLEADIPKTPRPKVNTPGPNTCNPTKAPPTIMLKENRNSKMPPTAEQVEARRNPAG